MMTDKAAPARSGLIRRTERAEIAVPLAGVTVDAELHGLYARVVVSHRYVNRETKPIEAVYVFPLDEGAAVCGFEAIIDRTLVVGEVHEREKAFERYDDAMSEGHGAFLLDEERPDVFQASIGNLLPGKEVLVRLTYVAELTVDDGKLRFVVPTTVSPRYAPAKDHAGVGRTDAETLNPPTAWTVPYGLNLSVRASMPGPIATVECPSHPISLGVNGAEATITLAQQDVALDRDFVLTIGAAGLDAPHLTIERQDDGTDAIGVAFAPRFEAATSPSEVIFVVDRSGSMDGQSIDEVRNALQLCLRSLTPGCRFNIVGFGSHYQALFAESRAYDQAALEIATEHVAALQADLGGTEILEPLKAMLEMPLSGTLPRQLVVLTDGEVTNTDAVIALAASHAARARIFTFGIGAGASHHLVRGLARAGGGAAEFIYPGERVEPKVLRQFARLLSPALTDVRLEWINGHATQSPSKVPPVFAGGRMLIYGFVKGTRPTSVRLAANSPSGALAWEVPLSVDVTSPSPGAGIVSKLAARARIRELEEGEWAVERGSRQRVKKESRARDEIVALSLRHAILSRETSFVAIERRETPVTGEIELRKVPIVLTTGWGGMEARQAWMAPRIAPSALPPGVHGQHLGSQMMKRARPSVRLDEDSNVAFSRVAPESAWLRVPERPASWSAMQALIMQQQADGSWPFTRELARVLGRELDDLGRALGGDAAKGPDALRAWATALALAWLEMNAGDCRDEWEMLAEKARRWLRDVPDGGLEAWRWPERAYEVLKRSA